MKILVTGTTGWLGAELARRLAQPRPQEEQHEVYGLARRPTSIPNVKSIRADIASDVDDLRETLSSHQTQSSPFDVVVHLAGAAGWCTLSRGIEVNVSGTQKLLECARNAGTTKFVIASSVGVTGTCSPRHPPVRLPVRNEDGFVAGSPWAYGKSKDLMEQTVRFMSGCDATVDYLLIRIGGVVSDPPSPLVHLESAIGEEVVVDAAAASCVVSSKEEEEVTVFPEFPLCAIALSDVMRCLDLAVHAPMKVGVRTITAVGPTAFTRDPVVDVMKSWYGEEKCRDIDMSHHQIEGNEFDPIYMIPRLLE